jgi:hypothetical protein
MYICCVVAVDGEVRGGASTGALGGIGIFEDHQTCFDTLCISTPRDVCRQIITVPPNSVYAILLICKDYASAVVLLPDRGRSHLTL